MKFIVFIISVLAVSCGGSGGGASNNSAAQNAQELPIIKFGETNWGEGNWD